VGSPESIQTISESPRFGGSLSFPASYLHVKTVSQITIIMKTFLAQPAGIATVDLWCKEKNKF
jgi:ethanolamine utilization protein EutP (predicted NTPase)